MLRCAPLAILEITSQAQWIHKHDAGNISALLSDAAVVLLFFFVSSFSQPSTKTAYLQLLF